MPESSLSVLKKQLHERGPVFHLFSPLLLNKTAGGRAEGPAGWGPEENKRQTKARGVS